MSSLTDLLVTGLTDLNTVRYTQTAITCLALYDYLCLLDDEINYFWQQKNWSTARVLFFANRYGTLAYVTVNTIGLLNPLNSDFFCNVWIKYLVEAGGLGIIGVVQLILALRIYSLFGHNFHVIIPLLVLWALSIIASAIIAHVALLKGAGTAHPFPGLHFCAPVGESRFVWAVWIPLCVYELVAFSLACWKSFSHLRDVWRHSAIHRVLTIMSRDSILYFAVILGWSVVSATWERFAPLPLIYLPVAPMGVTITALGSRMLLNIRRGYEESNSFDTRISCGRTDVTATPIQWRRRDTCNTRLFSNEDPHVDRKYGVFEMVHSRLEHSS